MPGTWIPVKVWRCPARLRLWPVLSCVVSRVVAAGHLPSAHVCEQRAAAGYESVRRGLWGPLV